MSEVSLYMRNISRMGTWRQSDTLGVRHESVHIDASFHEFLGVYDREIGTYKTVISRIWTHTRQSYPHISDSHIHLDIQEEYLPDGYVEDDLTRSKIRAHTTKEEHEKVLI